MFFIHVALVDQIALGIILTHFKFFNQNIKCCNPVFKFPVVCKTVDTEALEFQTRLCKESEHRDITLQNNTPLNAF